MIPEQKPPTDTAREAGPQTNRIVGKLTNAGTMQVSDELEVSGVFVAMERDAFKSVKYMPMYQDVEVVPTSRQRDQTEALLAGKRALEPFTHPDLSRATSGNIEGDASPVFGRDRAILTLGHFRLAAAALAAINVALAGDKDGA